MNKILATALITAAAIVVIAPEVYAQSSLGIGRSEQALPTGGMFEGFFNWIRNQQAEFQQTLRGILVDMRNGGFYSWSLIWICFLYGVFHAIGPGHGKVVISSYMLANEVALRRGVLISMAAAMMQGLTAILSIGFFLFALRGTATKTGDLAYYLEVASYVGVMFVGLWLLWRKTLGRGKGHHHSHDHHKHAHDHHHDDNHQHHDHEFLGHGDVCDHCGHSHAPDPKKLEGRFGMQEAWGAILAVGLRPCTGALIVLIFCFANGLYFVGITSTLVMALGTGLAVSVLAVLAVTAKNAALRVAGAQERVGQVTRIIEIGGAVMIFLIGLLLFTAVTGF